MPLEIVQVDAFTSEPFRGNPAAICILPEPADDAWMQHLALEMNLSETAYVLKQEDGFDLRWFTPSIEVNLCGHATLAAAHVLWEDGHVSADEACRFHTRSGLLTARRNDSWIEVDFPREEVTGIEVPPAVAEALGVVPMRAAENRLAYCLVEVPSEEIVRQMTPDMSALKKLPFHGYIVTSTSDTPEYDIVSRFFAPALGVDEDPVTGSAHCVLGAYWNERLGVSTLKAYQASPRGGEVQVTMLEDGVRLAGQAVTVMRATLV